MMKRLLTHTFAVSAFLLFAYEGGAASPPLTPTSDEVTCECQQSACGPCEVETGTTFYSAKCGPGNTRVKSCKKATCEPVENQKACLAEHEQNKSSSASETIAVAPVAPKASSFEADREPASVGSPAGEVDDVSGVARVTRVRGSVETARKKLVVYVGDTLETNEVGRLKVILKDSSEMVLPPNSKVKVENVDVDGEKKNKRQVTLNLLMGKVRNRVQKDYQGPENSFQVKTRTAVAGVRGTDFVTSFDPGKEEWITQVQTLEGKVQLGGKHAGTEPGAEKTVLVAAGTKSAFVVKAPIDVKDDTEIETSISNGVLLPVFSMVDDEKQLLDEATSFLGPQVKVDEIVPRTPASTVAASDEVCTEPRGKYNQCSFSCEGNPKGEKKCRTDLPGVACVRKLCRANGIWGESKRMPASQGGECEPQKPVVRDCGSYW